MGQFNEESLQVWLCVETSGCSTTKCQGEKWSYQSDVEDNRKFIINLSNPFKASSELSLADFFNFLQLWKS